MPTSTVRLVLADDHAVVRAGIANALRELPNIEIVGEIGDGPALIAMLAHTQPDVLVTDVTMPNFEPISTIRQTPRSSTSESARRSKPVIERWK